LKTDQPTKFSSLEQVIQHVLSTVEAHPERNFNIAKELVLNGKKRIYPAMAIGFPYVPNDHSVDKEPAPSPQLDIPNPEERQIAGEMLSMLHPFNDDILNPVNLGFGVCKGPGTLVTCFGIPLLAEAHNTPAYTISPDEILEKPVPTVESGIMKDMRHRIGRIKTLTPPDFKIFRPDTQGPFNLAHALVGDEAFLLPLTDPPKFHALIGKITDFYIQSVKALDEWIGPERRGPWDQALRLRECSVNLISREMYEEFVLPYDLRILNEFKSIGIHPCSGPHVFHATLDNIPGIRYTEAGYIEKTAAGSTEVADAVNALKGTSTALSIWEQIPQKDKEYETIKAQLDLSLQHPLMLFSYTGMNWRKKDKPLIREIHQSLNEYWSREILPRQQLTNESADDSVLKN
jgi:hypothetical protein